MRSFSSFALILCLSMAVAGCAQERVASTGTLSTSGVDNLVYGPTPSSSPASASAQTTSPPRGLIFAQAAPAPEPAEPQSTGSLPPPRGFIDAQNAPAPPGPSRGLFDAQSAPAPAPFAGASSGWGGASAPADAPPPSRRLIYAQAAPPLGPPPPMVAAPIVDTWGPQPGPVLYGSVPPVTPAPALNHYTLDAGDRLRVVVFGQEGLTNSYLVSATGQIDMPLIGAVVARERPAISWRAASAPSSATAISASRTSRSRSKPIGRSSYSAKSRSRANILT